MELIIFRVWDGTCLCLVSVWPKLISQVNGKTSVNPSIASEWLGSYYSQISKNWSCLYVFITSSSLLQPTCASPLRVNVHLLGLWSDCFQRTANVYLLHKPSIKLHSSLLQLASQSTAALVKIAYFFF